MSAKNKKTIAILLVCLAVIILACVAVAVIPKLGKTDDAFSIRFGNAVSLSYNCGGGEKMYGFTLSDGAWKSDGKENYPVRQTSMQSLARILASLTPESVIEAQDEMSAYGLDKPTYTLIAQDDEGNSLSIEIGKQTSASYYARISGTDGICIIPQALPLTLSNDFYAMLDVQKLPNISKDSMKRITLKDEKTGKTVRFEKEDEAWQVFDGALFVADDSVNIETEDGTHTARKFLNDVKEVLSGFNSCKCTAYGETGNKAITVTVETADNAYILYLGEGFEKDGTEYRAVFQNGDDAVYALESDKADSLLKCIEYLGQ